MKLFKQPLDKLFSPKAMKQLSAAINSPNDPANSAHSKRKRSSSSASCLRKFSGRDVNNNNNNSNSSNNSNNNETHGNANQSPSSPHSNNGTGITLTPQQQRLQLQLSVLPKPVRNLLNELYLRGPDTVGIFRKSPNAKHCKELRQKLEQDGQCSIEQFQVTVVASVFKEWLRSLPDCLLMSRLYPQWIDVAKLLEPLYQQQLPRHESQILADDSYFSDNTLRSGNASLRPSRSPLTDNGQAQQQQQQQQSQLQPLDRARSCSTMSDFSINRNPDACGRLDSSSASSTSSSSTTSSNGRTTTQQAPSMTAFALSERHSECLRIVRQLLDALNEPNLILLNSFICVLWHIAQNSDYNKMSANNLGVCVGQSLLNDEHQSNSKSTGLTFSNRLRRTKSQCLFSSTLSLSSPTLAKNGSYYMSSSDAQETAKYVPMLVSFMIENAPALFGQDITTMFSAHDILRKPVEATESEALTSTKMIPTNSMEQENQLPTADSSFDQIDCGKLSLMSVNGENLSSTPVQRVANAKQIVVESKFKPENEKLESDCIIPSENRIEDDGSLTTSILIVNPPKRLSAAQRLGVTKTQHRPLSVTESTSSSRASSSTSGVHSESPVFSSEADSQNRTTTSSCSRSPSSVSSSSPVSSISTSPVQEAQENHLCSSSDLLGSSQHHPQQQCYFMLCHRSPYIEPQRTHVMSLRDHYLSLQQQNHQSQQQHQQQHQHQLPTFYSTNNLSSLQHHPQQQEQYTPYHRSSLEPQRSHVMSLREYYLSVQQQNHQRQQQYQQQQQHQLPTFYSTNNLSSLQHHPQQQEQYMPYHRSSLEPQRSHVMSLRDYYLSMQQQNHQRQQQRQQQQQQQISYRTSRLSYATIRPTNCQKRVCEDSAV